MISRNGITLTRVELATHDTDLKADVGDFSGQSNLQTLEAALGIPETAGKPLYTCVITDRLDHVTFGLTKISTDIAAVLLETGTNGVVLGTKVAAFKRLVGEGQIAITTEDLDQIAGTYDLLTGTDGAVLLTALSIKMPTGAPAGAVTSIAVATDDSTPGVFLNATDGAVANLTSEAEFSWTGEMVIGVGTIIQLALVGGASAAEHLVAITAKYEAIADTGYLAESA